MLVYVWDGYILDIGSSVKAEVVGVKYALKHIKEIKKLAIELRKDLSNQPLEIRRKLSSIANLAALFESDIYDEGIDNAPPQPK